MDAPVGSAPRFDWRLHQTHGTLAPMVFTGRFFAFLAFGFLPIIGGTLDPRLFWIGFAYDAGVLAVAVLDFVVLRSRGRIRIVRQVPSVVSIGVPFDVTIEAENPGMRPLELTVKDTPPHQFDVPSRTVTIRLPSLGIVTRGYPVRANLRGTFQFHDLFYRVGGVTGLIQLQGKIAAPFTVKVYPNVKNLSLVELAIAQSSQMQLGLRATRVSGEGREFESLRPYMCDDDYRWIDWKATARRSQLVSREYEAERNQRLLILLDVGRLMSPKVGDFRKLDYAVNAAAMLSQVGLMKGDLVGLQVFTNEIVRYLPPERGRGQFVQLVDTLFEIQPQRFESDYALAFAHAARRNSRRALMVCFTDLLDSESSQTLITSMLRLMPRHLPMCVTISDSDLLAARQQTPETAMDVFEKVAAAEVWEDYRRAIGLLEGRGAAVVHVPAHELTTATINRYLEIKGRGLL